jgi:hypothetical protein
MPQKRKGLGLLVGATAIAEYVFGDEKHARRIYQPKIRKQLGLFLLNGQLCGRPVTIDERIAAKETAAESTTTA